MEDMLRISPEVMAKAKRMGEYFSIEIRKDCHNGIVEVRYTSTNPCPFLDVGNWAEELSNQLAWGHSMAFGMKGTITDMGNEKPPGEERAALN